MSQGIGSFHSKMRQPGISEQLLTGTNAPALLAGINSAAALRFQYPVIVEALVRIRNFPNQNGQPHGSGFWTEMGGPLQPTTGWQINWEIDPTGLPNQQPNYYEDLDGGNTLQRVFQCLRSVRKPDRHEHR